MYPIAHIGITLFFASLFSLSFFYVAIASLLPDIIDKPLAIIGLVPCGRHIGHTFFTGIIISGLAYLIMRKKFVSISLLFGFLMHLLLDQPGFMPWFYPFIPYDFSACPAFGAYGLFAFITDSMGLASLVFLFYTNFRFRGFVLGIIDNIKSYILRRNP